ncbi:MAG: diguanylate cyclase [Desulfobacter sp.]|nr:MAG: diguanylate cyclase [Desulfobacter sp.]
MMQFIKSSLQAKALLIILGIFISFGALDLMIKHYIIYPSFIELEMNEARNDLERCKEAIDSEILYIDQVCFDWAAWTDTYQYAQDHNPLYEKSNLLIDTYTLNKLDLIIIIDDKNRVVWNKILAPETHKEIELDYFKGKIFHPGHGLFPFDTEKPLSRQGVKGVYNSEYGPLIISSRPILTSANQGPAKGTMYMGRFLSNKVIESIKSQIRVDFQIILPASRDGDGEFTPLSLSIDAENGTYIRMAEDIVTMYAKYTGIDGKPAFIVKTDFARKITEKGFVAVRSSMILMTISSLIVLSIVMVLLKIFILTPISLLTELTQKIKENQDFGSRAEVDRSDEIGVLARGLNGMMDTIVEQTDLLIESNLKLQHASSTDGLTGIYNRRQFDETYHRDWGMHLREKKPLGLILMDIDFFKSFNDTYGHQMGDTCLKQVAETISRGLKRSGDVAARYGGEEFVVILPNTDLAGTLTVAENIRQAVVASKIAHKTSRAANHVTLSLGAGSIIPFDGITPDLFVEYVDKALYSAKEQGRNQVTPADLQI